MRNNRLVTALVVVILLAVNAGMVYNSLRSLTTEAKLVGFDRWVACESCDELYWGVLEARPGACKKCGEMALWPAGECRDPECAHKFPVNTFKLRAQGREAYCPKCNSGRVSKVLDPAP